MADMRRSRTPAACVRRVVDKFLKRGSIGADNCYIAQTTYPPAPRGFVVGP